MTAPPTDPFGTPPSDPFPPDRSASGTTPRQPGPPGRRPNRYVVAIVLVVALGVASFLLSRPSGSTKDAASTSVTDPSGSAGQAEPGSSPSSSPSAGANGPAPATGATPASGSSSAGAGSKPVGNCRSSTLGTGATPVPVGSSANAGETLKSATYNYTVAASATPQIEVAGKLSGPLPKGSHLFTADWADPASTDSTSDHSPGNARYYPAPELRLTPDLCFRQVRYALGYPGFGGMRVRIYVLLVDAAHSKSFARKGAEQDGFTDSGLASHGATPVGYFVVQTPQTAS
jgi:hypothetical protein